MSTEKSSSTRNRSHIEKKTRETEKDDLWSVYLSFSLFLPWLIRTRRLSSSAPFAVRCFSRGVRLSLRDRKNPALW